MSKKNQNKPKVDPVEEVVVEDRSEYNCPSCAGEGIEVVSNRQVLCHVCLGTGKKE